ncbi:MAG: nickel pincer cofactor biosynthesis protein LarC [Bacteroidales bacterium]|jgi:uncharacterized protein (TIGR00299 family) protein|nr:nickel pincer cofactor biosynthesis protein LarC [Bacteroidales bacterium]
MKILSYDCFSGISGDMNLGAMIDLGIEKEFLAGELNKLNLRGWEIEVQRDQRHGIYGTKVTVRQTVHEHVHRHLSDIEKIISGSGLGSRVKELSMKIFTKIAEAEARVHGTSVEEVHFHEVGAIDSIIDVVGAAICFDALDVGAVHVSPVELGGGLVKCAHGTLPVPAPATAEIIKGIPVTKGGVDFEATTPTGAAIVAALGSQFGAGTVVKVERSGYGIGHKQHDRVPNILRITLGETAGAPETGHNAIMMECNIDDMNPEFFDYISEKLFRAGAADVFLSNVIMKKGRPGAVLHAICEKEFEEPVKKVIFTESTSLGIRVIPFRKETLAREFETVETTLGQVRIKRSFYNGAEVSVKPEYDDCRQIASETNLPLKEVYSTIMATITASSK